ncbi:MAG: glycosyltransferase family 1 protein, partial [Pseudomonadota bacterium]
PVITNITSDLGDHLRDGEEGLVCQAPSVDALCHVLERAQTLDADALGAMRQAARAEADRAFTYQRFAEPMGAFIESLRSKTRGRT